jgi:hypothetical protein
MRPTSANTTIKQHFPLSKEKKLNFCLSTLLNTLYKNSILSVSFVRSLAIKLEMGVGAEGEKRLCAHAIRPLEPSKIIIISSYKPKYSNDEFRRTNNQSSGTNW